MTCPVPPTWPIILALFIAMCGYYFATGVLLAKMRALQAKLRDQRTMKKAPWTVTLDEFDVYALGRGAYWTFGEGRVAAALRSIADRAEG